MKTKDRELEIKMREVIAKANEVLEELGNSSPDKVKILTLVAEDMEELIIDAGNTLLRGSIPSIHDNVEI